MPETPFSKKVHVKVIPSFETDPDSGREYYVSVELSPLECQLSGERFLSAVRDAIKSALQGGKIAVYCDKKFGQGQPINKGDSQVFMHRMARPDEFDPTTTRRHTNSEGKSLTEFSIDTTISHTIT